METQIVIHRVDELQVMSKAMAETKMFGFKTQQEAFALMLIAQAEGRHPATIAQDYDVIQGRPAIKSSAALARFQMAGGTVRWIVSNATNAEAEFSHPKGGTLLIRWDMARAAAAGLSGKDNWKKFPDQMLRARCASEGVRAVFPACLNGMYVSEEVQDFEPREQREPRQQSQNSRKLDPSKAVDQAPPPAPPAEDPIEVAAKRLAKIRARYLEACAAAALTIGDSLPEKFEASDNWTEAEYIAAKTDLDSLVRVHKDATNTEKSTTTPATGEGNPTA